MAKPIVPEEGPGAALAEVVTTGVLLSEGLTNG
jgi:hypothetical protein